MKHVLRPLFDRIVIKELEPERMRQSGLVVPAGSNEPLLRRLAPLLSLRRYDSDFTR